MKAGHGLLLMLTLAITVVSVGTSASAAQLLYTVATTGSGTLDGTGFTDQAITIKLVADPATDIASFGLAPTSQTITIGGLGTFTFTNQVYFGASFANVFYLAGRNTTAFVRDILDVQLPDYTDIYVPFAAVTGVVTTPGFNQFTGIATSGGALGLTQATAVTISAVAAAVPEPAAWALMIVGFGAAGLNTRRRRKLATRAA